MLIKQKRFIPVPTTNEESVQQVDFSGTFNAVEKLLPNDLKDLFAKLQKLFFLVQNVNLSEEQELVVISVHDGIERLNKTLTKAAIIGNFASSKMDEFNVLITEIVNKLICRLNNVKEEQAAILEKLLDTQLQNIKSRSSFVPFAHQAVAKNDENEEPSPEEELKGTMSSIYPATTTCLKARVAKLKTELEDYSYLKILKDDNE